MDSVVVTPVRSSLRRGWRMALIILLILLLVAASLLLYGYWLLAKSLPVTSGEVVISGLQADVSVYRDQNGVPHIEADNLHDLYLAQGYITAQDRLFQMDLSRRQASGRLSEVVGEKAVERDKFFRTMGLRRAAEASLPAYSAEARQVLEWYAEGVNAYMKEAIAENKLPVEFWLLGYQPEPWSPIDSLTIGKYMAYDLGGHWEGQAFRYYLLQHFPAEKAFDLFPSYPEDAPVIVQIAQQHPIDIADHLAVAVIPNEWNGSNNWVLSGKKTVSGKPLLANDPHLGLGMPAIWYESHLMAPDMDVSGVIFAGVPGIIVGHNQHIAWGVTNVGPDVQDLYIEKRNPEQPDQFLYMGRWETAEVVREDIAVKGGATIPYEVTITRHGPLLSEFAHDHKEETALALKWTALEPSTELEAVLMMNRAKNWEEFKQALQYFHTPAQNFVFASVDGTIAYRANGLIPIRKAGDGSVPVPGWTDEYEWSGYIPWDELPTVVNPESGLIATANNKVIDDSYPYHITNTWAQPHRQNRILEVLASKDTFTAEEMKQLQLDKRNMQAKQLLPPLLAELEKQSGLRELDREAIAILKQWEYEDAPDLAAPLVFNLWMIQIADTLFADQIDPELDDLFEGKTGIVDRLLTDSFQGSPGPWIREKGGIGNVALQSFQRTIDKIVELQGDDPASWNWGEYHTVTFEHPLAAVKPLDLLFNLKAVAIGGSKVTVGMAGWDGQTGEVEHGGVWRTVVDLSDLTQSYNVIGPGQSGHRLSPWYDDQIDDWTEGNYHLTSTTNYQNEEHHLRLLPSR
ncbi:penicillin acylase family protein [Brevibacillus humidisoli]|uniref:penicillin acylase family protein n=1 Tax=Brevibacillus humidisoli TaxID=2895522 RepID=UPI001E57909B|nr:penicillin acylase family protein [Brevibacillus humidisoli]UFJ41433.1 penicillin acylase family protein [Brevibacillus humidisoli]